MFIGRVLSASMRGVVRMILVVKCIVEYWVVLRREGVEGNKLINIYLQV
jgi:hypothetical protein